MPKSWASKTNTLGGANALPFFCPFFGAILPHIQTSFRSSVAQMIIAELGSGLSFPVRMLTQPVSEAAWRICTKKVRLRPKSLISCNVPFGFWSKSLISCNVPPNVPKSVPNVPKCSSAGEHYREVLSIAKAVRTLMFRVSGDCCITQILQYGYVVVVVNCNVPF